MKAFRAVPTFATLCLITFTSACGPEGEPVPEIVTTQGEIREVTRREALADFDQMVDTIRGLYGPLEWKERRHRINFDRQAMKFRIRIAFARTEADVFALYNEFLAVLKDAHVSLSAPFLADTTRSFSIPLLVMPIEDTYVVYAVGRGIDIERGDELVSIDRVSPTKLMSRYVRYISTPTEAAAKHMASLYLTFRPAYLSQGIKNGEKVELRLRKPSGELKTVTLEWKADETFLPPAEPVEVQSVDDADPKKITMVSQTVAQVTRAELLSYGEPRPFFLTPAVVSELGLSEPIRPSSDALAKYGLTPASAASANYYAATYEREGKKLLLLRIHDYTPADTLVAINYLQALLDEQQPLVDALVIDQTHNPGGNASFALDFISLFATKPVNGLVQRNNADRMWIGSLGRIANQLTALGPIYEPYAKEYQQRAQLVDEAYSAYQPLAQPFPLTFWEEVITPIEGSVLWEKPFLMLVNELSVSCGDFVPAIFKANGLGTIFGQQTTGAGGNVQVATTLANTQAQLYLTRGLGTIYDPTGAYPESRFIEDNGVEPDVTYSHTLADFRAGYVDYAKAFTNEVLKLIPSDTTGN